MSGSLGQSSLHELKRTTRLGRRERGELLRKENFHLLMY